MRKAFICPTKYVQGENELLNLGYFVKTFGKTGLLIADPFAKKLVAEQLEATQAKYKISLVSCDFGGECTREEVKKLQEFAKANKAACIIGLGGGKAIDTAKCVANGSNLIIVPTIAATDAPTSHSAVLYHADHSFDDYAYFRQSPSVVLIDTTVIANAPARFLVSGMGDALSTYFEARANERCFAKIGKNGVNAGLPCGADRAKGTLTTAGTMAANALAKLCYETLISDGAKAKAACECNVVTPALEKIIETNILLSGLGFESGGLAAVLNFCETVGLPICLRDMGAENTTDEELKAVAEKASIPDESVHNMPFPVTADMVYAAIKAADKIGHDFKYCECDCEC